MLDNTAKYGLVSGKVVSVTHRIVERNYFYFVRWAELFDERNRRALQRGQLLPRAFTGIKQKNNMRRCVNGRKEGNLLWCPILSDAELFFSQIRDIFARAQARHHRNGNEVSLELAHVHVVLLRNTYRFSLDRLGRLLDRRLPRSSGALRQSAWHCQPGQRNREQQ